ncbi:MAG: prolipoprotein diacylglyceryl transferase [Bacteroidales bacterium]|nr:prolipoprotein diacylglyceryl transferase [Bacteroidales bacterium]
MSFFTIDWGLDPVAFSIAGEDIRWYSLLFVCSILWGWFFARWVARREGVGSEVYVPLIFWVLVGFYLGGKLGNRLFYSTGSFGGFSSFGAAIGIFLAIWVFSMTTGRRHGISFLWLMDRFMPCGIIACVPVRIGNFCNSELVGTPASLPWGVIFERTGDMLARHPVQLYEAAVFLLMGILMIWLYKKRGNSLPTGFIAGLSMMAVALVRFLTEFVKESTRNVDFGQFSLHTAQVLCIPLFLFGAGILLHSVRLKREMK